MTSKLSKTQLHIRHSEGEAGSRSSQHYCCTVRNTNTSHAVQETCQKETGGLIKLSKVRDSLIRYEQQQQKVATDAGKISSKTRQKVVQDSSQLEPCCRLVDLHELTPRSAVVVPFIM